MLPWVDRLLDVTERDPLGLVIPWQTLEGELGVTLPEDYKQICESFGMGEFSSFLTVDSRNENGIADLLTSWRNMLEIRPIRKRSRAQSGEYEYLDYFRPYGVYRPTNPGLLHWGSGQPESDFYWLVNPTTDRPWPIIAREDRGEAWKEFAMSTSEFIFRILTDRSFHPFSVAHLFPQPFFQPTVG